MNDEIEVLDFDEDEDIIRYKKPSNVSPVVSQNNNTNNGNKNKEVVKSNNNSSKTVKRKPKKITRIIQIVFCCFSFLFIIGCCIFYGSRFIKYYRIYNPKIETGDGSILLSNDISGNSEIVYEGSGLYISGGNYIYKGDVKNNYVLFNNLLWRIVKINKDNTIDIILDDYLSLSSWNSEVTSFKESDIYHYLNDTFLNSINKNVLTKSSYCTDKVSDLSNITCEKQELDSYVRLLDITTFLNTVKDKKSYMVNDDEIFWLSDYSDDKIWHVNGINASQSESTNFYEIRPVVRLKNTIYYKDGDGTKDNPYVIENDKEISLGSKVKLGNDTWIVYDMKDDIKLIKEDILEKTYHFDKESLTYDIKSKDSLADYLNTTYLDSLSYKDMLVETTWYTGSFNGKYNDIYAKEVKSKVGIPNLIDAKIDSSVKGYFLSTSNKDSILVYENPIRVSKVTTYRSIRPTIAISKSSTSKFTYNNGIYEVK